MSPLDNLRMYYWFCSQAKDRKRVGAASAAKRNTSCCHVDGRYSNEDGDAAAGDAAAGDAAAGDVAHAMEREECSYLVEKGKYLVEEGRYLVEEGRDLAEEGRDLAEEGRYLAEEGRYLAEEGRYLMNHQVNFLGNFTALDKKVPKLNKHS